jgi:oligopeptide transport system ATP-binding protein
MTKLQKGCPFQPRCDFAREDCVVTLAPLTEFEPGRKRACNRSLEELA